MFNLLFPIYLHRNPGEPHSHHGQAGAGLVYALQAGDREGRPGGGDQQEDLERNHKGTQFAYLHHQRCFYSAHTVSLWNLIYWSKISPCVSLLNWKDIHCVCVLSCAYM